MFESRPIDAGDIQRQVRQEKADDGWIKHDGGECPIPWARAGEFEHRLRNGEIRQKEDANRPSWSHPWGEDEDPAYDIIAYRLTDGWIPVVGWKCPFDLAKFGEHKVEIRWRDDSLWIGHHAVKLICCAGWEGSIVAVRLIKRPDESIIETRDHKEPGISRAAKSTKFIPDLFEQRMASFEAKRAAKKRKNPVPEIGMREMLAIAGKAMED